MRTGDSSDLEVHNANIHYSLLDFVGVQRPCHGSSHVDVNPFSVQSESPWWGRHLIKVGTARFCLIFFECYRARTDLVLMSGCPRGDILLQFQRYSCPWRKACVSAHVSNVLVCYAGKSRLSGTMLRKAIRSHVLQAKQATLRWGDAELSILQGISSPMHLRLVKVDQTAHLLHEPKPTPKAQ